MSSTFINNLLKITEQKDFKNNIVILFKPIIDIILFEIYPYLYIICTFVIICFLLILAIFIILVQYKHYSII